ncbi:MAG: diacylglycerol kinase [Alphaproteobacteria bacterium]|nr:diacylglycerol kinase [Alphaproteobacteria bacterium]
MKSPHKGIKRILHAFKYSYDGFIAVFKSEAAFRQDLVVFAIGTAAALLLPFTPMTRAILISSLLLILLMELVNTAIEVVIDRISDDYHKLSKTAKDIGSLLVLLSFINAGVIWSIALVQYLGGAN